jgi:hypothetical protein
MRIKVIKVETDRIVVEHGALAAKIVLAMLKSARQRKNMRLERFLKQVAAELQRRALKRLAPRDPRLLHLLMQHGLAGIFRDPLLKIFRKVRQLEDGTAG